MEEKVKELIASPLETLNIKVDSISIVKESINIVLDSDEVLDLDKVVEASHLINEILDEKTDIRDKYMIDISSKEKGGN